MRRLLYHFIADIFDTIERILGDLALGVAQLCSPEFWRAFGSYWKPEAVAARLDEWTLGYCYRTGKIPSRDLVSRVTNRARNREAEV